MKITVFHDVTPHSLIDTTIYKPSEDLGTSVFWVKEYPEDGGSRFLWNILFAYYSQPIAQYRVRIRVVHLVGSNNFNDPQCTE